MSLACWRPVAALALLALASCAGEGIVDPTAPVAACTDVAPFRPEFDCIQQLVFTPICTLCHVSPGAPEGLDLSDGRSFDNLVGITSNQAFPPKLRVAPGDPNDSYLIHKLEGTDPGLFGSRMPFGGPYLSQAEIDVIRQWILDGAEP